MLSKEQFESLQGGQSLIAETADSSGRVALSGTIVPIYGRGTGRIKKYIVRSNKLRQGAVVGDTTDARP